MNNSSHVHDTRGIADQIVIDVWLVFCATAGILGNAFVLYASVKHNAVKIDGMSLWFIKCLCVADISSVVVMVIPVLITNLAGNRWIFGSAMCVAIGFLSRVPFIMNILLIVGLSLNKLYCLSFPLRALVISQKMKKFWLSIFLVVAVVNPALGLFFNNFQLHFHYNEIASICRIYGEGRTVVTVRLLFYIILPSLLLMLTNTALILLATRKTQTTVNKRNIVIVLGVTLQYLLAFIPYTVVLTIAYYYPISDWLIRGAFQTLYISCWFNPLVYYQTNPSFHDFSNRSVVCWYYFCKGVPQQERRIAMCNMAIMSGPRPPMLRVNVSRSAICEVNTVQAV